MAKDNVVKYGEYGKDGLGPKQSGPGIGGTHNVSTKVDPDAARRGQHTPIKGDVPHPGGDVYAPDN